MRRSPFLPSRFSKVFLIFLSLGGVSVYGQDTSPLDTAPGGGNATLTNSAPTGTPTPAPDSPAPAPVTEGPSLLSNSKFDEATKDPTWPDGWPKGNGISWKNENGVHYLELVQQEPGKMLTAYREMSIPADVKGLKIKIRYRTSGVVHGVQNWMDARALFHFIDDSRNPVKPDPKVIRFSTKKTAWTEGTSACVVPAGATKLVLMPSLFQAAAGTLDLQEVSVTVLDEGAVSALNAAIKAREEKDAIEDAAVASDIALPAKTTELKVSGNQLVTANGTSVWLQGVNVVQLAWSPNGEGHVLWAEHVAINDWHANVIRLPVMDSFWFGKGRGQVTSNDQEAYRTLVDNAIKMAAGKGVYVVLDLHRFLTPDASCVAFWNDAAARYKNNPAVLFDIFNEPHGTTWDVWQKGGPVEMKQKDGTSKTVQSVGMQALVDAVRGTGAKNIIVAGGLGYAYEGFCSR